ncbi:unnamed protein product, partial [Ectocarpus sp. 12 AP-2014]
RVTRVLLPTAGRVRAAIDDLLRWVLPVPGRSAGTAVWVEDEGCFLVHWSADGYTGFSGGAAGDELRAVRHRLRPGHGGDGQGTSRVACKANLR